MARPPKKTVDAIVEDAMPGWQVISTASDSLVDARSQEFPADQVGRDSAALKRKYRRNDPASTDAVDESPGAPEVRFVRVAGTAPTDAPAGAKTVVIDVRAGKVRGVQG